MPCEPHPNGVDHAAPWYRLAANTTRHINLGWFLEALTRPSWAVGVAVAAILLVGRKHGIPIHILATTCIPLGITVAGLVAWLRSRKQFETPAQSLIRIESALHLHNALTAANAGFSSWPTPPRSIPMSSLGLQWQWRRLAATPLLALFTIVTALWIPLDSTATTKSPPPREPIAWSQLSQELDALMETAIIEETYLEQTSRRLAELRSREPNDWYSHNSMEATDALADGHRNEKNRLDDNLTRAGNALDRMQQSDPDLRQRQFQEFQLAVEEMANGAMRPNRELMEQLQSAGQENHLQLNPQQLDRLRNQLRDAREALKNAPGLPDLEPGEDGFDDGPPIPGMGEPGEDGEHAPGVLGDNAKPPLEIGEFTPLAAQDLSKAALGDLLEIQNSSHETSDPSPRPPASGGTTDATGRGGDRIWRDTLLPSEQRTIRKFFE